MSSPISNSVGIGLLFLGGLFSGSVAAACPDPSIAIGKVEGLVMDASFDQVKPAIQEVETAWSCGGAVQPAALSRLLVLQGGWLSMSGSKDQAAMSFRAARRVSPDTWVDNLGPQLKQEYLAAQDAPVSAPGQVLVDPALPEGFRPQIDGADVTLPAPTLAGYHLVQVLDKRDDAFFARLILVQPGETVTVATGSLQEVAAQRATERKPFPVLVVTGVGTGLLAGGAAWLANGQDASMQEAGNLDDLDSAYTRQRIFAVSAYTLGAAALTQVSLHFVL